MKLKVCILQNIFMLLPIITEVIKCIDHMKYIMYYRFNQQGNCLNRSSLIHVRLAKFTAMLTFLPWYICSNYDHLTFLLPVGVEGDIFLNQHFFAWVAVIVGERVEAYFFVWMKICVGGKFWAFGKGFVWGPRVS